MSTTARPRLSPEICAELLAHLAAQLQSARRMQAVVSEQGIAIRRRAVPEVVRLAGSLQAEMHRREVLELDRVGLQQRAALTLGIDPADVNIMRLGDAMDATSAQAATELATELRALLHQINREHTTNRALMQQELAFLDHLLRLAGNGGGYGAGGERNSPAKRNRLMRRPVIELEA